jgi:hypothetical protein
MTNACRILALSLLMSASATTAAHAVVVEAMFEGKVSSVDEIFLDAPGEVGMNARFTVVFDTETVGAQLVSTPNGVSLSSSSVWTTPVSRFQITKPDLGLDFDMFPRLAIYDGLDGSPENLTTRVSIEDTAAGRELKFSIEGFASNPRFADSFGFRVVLSPAQLPLSLSAAFSVDLAVGEGTGFEFFDYAEFASQYYLDYALDRVTFRVPSVTPVPVPAAFPLLASGLAAIGLVARKRRRSLV